MTKRWLSLVLVLTLLATCIAAGASAAGAIAKDVVTDKKLTFVPNSSVISAKNEQAFPGYELGYFQVDGVTVTSADSALILLLSSTFNSIAYNGGTPAASVQGGKLIASFAAPTVGNGIGSVSADIKFNLNAVPDIAGYETSYFFSDGAATTISTVKASEKVTSVLMDKSSLTISGGVGDTATVIAAAVPSLAANEDKTAIWSSSDEKVVKVSGAYDAAGTVTISAKTYTGINTATITAVDKGSAKVIATFPDGKSISCTVTVSEVAVNSITGFTGAPATFYIGDTMKLVPTVASSTAAVPTSTTYTWASGNSAVATVDKDGVVTGVKAGSAQITVTALNGKTYSENITVAANAGNVVQPVAMEFTPSYDVADQHRIKKDATIKLSSNTKDTLIYYVIDSGAAADDWRADAGTLKVGPTNGILYNSANPIVLSANNRYTIYATAWKGTYSSDLAKEYVAVDIDSTKLEMSQATATITGAGKLKLTATVTPANANVVDTTWAITAGGDAHTSINDTTGEFVTDGTPGEYTITATSNHNTVLGGSNAANGSGTNRTATCTIKVAKADLKGVTASPAKLTVEVGNTAVFTAVCTPTNATVVSADASKAEAGNTVLEALSAVSKDADGNPYVTVTGRAAGSTTVYLNVNGKRVACEVTVATSTGVAVPVFSAASGTVFTKADVDVGFKMTSATRDADIFYTEDGSAPGTVAGGSTKAYTAGTVLKPDANKTVTYRAVAVAGGVSSGVSFATYTTEYAVTKVTLDQTSLTINGTAKANLNASFEPASPKNTGLTWASDNEAVAKVEAKKDAEGVYTIGEVSGVAQGTANITVTSADGGFKATCKVTVNKISVGTVAINPVGPIALKANQAVELEVVFSAPENPSNTKVTWESSAPTIAKVDDKGVVTALKEGSAVITLTTVEGSKTATVTVNVAGTQLIVDAPTIAPNGGTYVAEQEITLACATVGAKLYYTTDGLQPTTSSNLYDATAKFKIAKDCTVRVLAVKEGMSNAEASVDFKITIPVATVELDKAYAKLAKGSTLQLTATVKPDNAKDVTVTWVSDSDKVTVDKNGLVKAVDTVTGAKITAKSGTASASCIIDVTPTVPTKVTVAPATLTMGIGDQKNLTTVVEPTGASGTVTWSSSDVSIATVTAGVVTAVKAGSVTITATCGEIKGTCAVTVKADPTEKPAEPMYLPTFTATKTKFEVTENGSLTAELGKFAAGTGETWEQIAYYYNIKIDPLTFTNGTVAAVANVDENGVVTLYISNAGVADETTFTYTWSLAWKRGGVNGGLHEQGRTVSGNTLTITEKPNADKLAIEAAKTAIATQGGTVASADAKTADEAKAALLAALNKAIASTGIVLTANDITLTDFVAAVDGTAEKPEGTPGSFKYTVNLVKGSESDMVSNTGKITPKPFNTKKEIAIASATKPYDTMYKKTPVKVLNVADGTVTFSVPGYTATNWKSSKPKYISIDAVTGVATLNKPGSTTRFTITCMVEGTKLTQVVRIQKIATAMKMQYKDGKKWIDFADGTAAVKVELGKKLEIRAVNLTGSKRYSPVWATSDSAVVGPYKKSFSVLKGKALGTATVSLTLYNDVKAIIAIEVVPVGTKGAIESIEEEAIVEIEEIEELDMIEELED